MMSFLFGVACTGALLTTPPTITIPSSIIHLPDPSVIHLPAAVTPARHMGGVRALPAPRTRRLLPMPKAPAGLLSWSGASTFRALVPQLFAIERFGGGARRHARA